MKDTILQKMTDLERSANIRILYACESGSRAWGFASPDSDFDVRFLYAHPLDHYLSIADTADHVGLPVNEVLDISGWDIRKALKLFLKSNSTLYEWLQSPIVYQERTVFANDLRALMPKYFDLRAGANHYLSMAFNTLRDDLQSEQVKLKRYFYALRPALACLWIVDRKTVPPMEFGPLRELIADATIQGLINELMERKKDAAEKAFIQPVSEMNDWLAQTLDHCREQIPSLTSTKRDTRELDTLFRKYLTP